MADIISDWTDDNGDPRVPIITPQTIAVLSAELDNKINKATHMLNDMNQECRELQCRIERMKETSLKLREMVWADADMRAIDGIAVKARGV